VDLDSQQIGIAVNAAPPAVVGNDLSTERRGLSDKMMSLCFVQRITLITRVSVYDWGDGGHFPTGVVIFFDAALHGKTVRKMSPSFVT
jgi:hypothetical protein